jgi:hypothetical protein
MFRNIGSLFILFSLLGCDSHERRAIQPSVVEEETEDIVVESEESLEFLDMQEVNLEDKIDKFTNTPPEDDTQITYGAYRSPKPPSWFWVPPKTVVVTCNYVVPSIDDSEHAIFSITQFQKGEGGHFEENVARWKRLFRTNDGAPVKPRIDVITVNNHDAVIAEFKGEYMGAGAAWHLKNHSLLVAEVREPDGNIYFKLLGPTVTVDAHTPSFLKTIQSLELLPTSP